MPGAGSEGSCSGADGPSEPCAGSERARWPSAQRVCRTRVLNRATPSAPASAPGGGVVGCVRLHGLETSVGYTGRCSSETQKSHPPFPRPMLGSRKVEAGDEAPASAPGRPAPALSSGWGDSRPRDSARPPQAPHQRPSWTRRPATCLSGGPWPSLHSSLKQRPCVDLCSSPPSSRGLLPDPRTSFPDTPATPGPAPLPGLPCPDRPSEPWAPRPSSHFPPKRTWGRRGWGSAGLSDAPQLVRTRSPPPKYRSPAQLIIPGPESPLRASGQGAMEATSSLLRFC